MTVNRHYIIAINGGIGSGKSVVSRIVTVMGYPVYDCDAQARQLMDSSDEIKAAISAGIHHACIKDGQIDRAMLASIVFEDKEKLAILNSIVHGAVREHFASWAEDQAGTVCFVETAILYQSGMDTMVDEVDNQRCRHPPPPPHRTTHLHPPRPLITNTSPPPKHTIIHKSQMRHVIDIFSREQTNSIIEKECHRVICA